MVRGFLGVCLVVPALLAACGDDGSDAPDDASATGGTATPSAAISCTPALPREPGEAVEGLPSGVVERTYLVRVPPGYDGTRRTPLLLAFHPSGASKESFAEYTGLPALTDDRGFILVLPDAAGEGRRWNIASDPASADDLQFVRDLIARLDGELCVDATRTFAAGFSIGGGMAQLAACELTESFAAVALVAATYVNCRVNLPLVGFHGLDDASVPFEGGEIPPERGGGSFPPVRRSVSEWARTVGCDGLATITRPSTEIEVSTFINCPDGDGEVMLYAIIGGGHTWPGAAPLESVGFTTQQVSASELLLDFFTAHAKGE